MKSGSIQEWNGDVQGSKANSCMGAGVSGGKVVPQKNPVMSTRGLGRKGVREGKASR